MPRPVYIICSESHSTDRATGLVSLFHVLEGYTVALGDARSLIQEHLTEARPQPAMLFATFIITALWMRQDTESVEDEFEHEFLVKNPEDLEPVVMQHTVVRIQKQFYRFALGIQKINSWTVSGICELTSRMRMVGSKDWTQQTYPLPITVHQREAAEEPENADELD